MSAEREEKILTRHPEGKRGVNISKRKYEVVREAMLSILKSRGEVTHAELVESVERLLKGRFEGSIPWYM